MAKLEDVPAEDSMLDIAEPTREDPQLPPAGHERNETLKQREDALQEKLEQRTSSGDIGAIDKRKIRVENEIAQHFDMLDVSDRDPMYVYTWVWTGMNGLKIREKMVEYQTLTKKNNGGWVIVQGNDPEALELKGTGADSTRRLGDVILMKIRKDHYIGIQKALAAKNVRREEGIEAGLRELGDRYAATGVRVHTDASTMTEGMQKRLFNQGRAKQVAIQMEDKWMREGRMPGVKV